MRLLAFASVKDDSRRPSTVRPQPWRYGRSVATPHPDGEHDGIDAVLADLEQQAHGLHLRERDEDLAALAAAEHARLTLEERVHGSVGRSVTARVVGGETLSGVVEAAGRGWCALAVGSRTWWLLLAAVTTVSGLGPRALVEAARPATGRLGVGAPLRELAERGVPVVVLLRDGTRLEGRVARVGGDFVEVRTAHDPTVEAVPYAAIAGISAGSR